MTSDSANGIPPDDSASSIGATALTLLDFSAAAPSQVVDGAYLEQRRLPGGTSDVDLLHAVLPGSTLDRGDYAPAVLINGNFGRDAITLGTTLTARKDAFVNGRDMAVGDVTVYPEGSEICYRAWPNCTWMAFNVPRSRVEQFCEERFGRAGDLPDRILETFRPASRASSRRLAEDVRDLTDSLRLMGDSPNRERIGRAVEESLLNRMLSVVVDRPPTHRAGVHAKFRHCREVLIKAMDRVESDAESMLDLVTLAEATGLSPRTLQRTFRSACDLCPEEWFRVERLHRARQELLRAKAPGAVTSAAMRWGFFHFGRFAKYYREVFGELPSQTVALACRAANGRL